MNTQPEPHRFHELFDQSGVAQAVVSLDGLIVAVNQATCAMFGREASEVIGEPILSRVPLEWRDDDAALLEEVASGSVRAVKLERRLPHHDGSYVDALVSVAGVRVDGQVSELLVCLQDITALKEAHRIAVGAEARWRSLSQNASDLALITDADLVMRYVSPAMTVLLGHSEADVLGRSLLTLVHPEDKARVHATVERLVAGTGGDGVLEYRIFNSEGSWRYVEQRLVNLLKDPHVRGLVANLRDRTAQHELEATLLRTTLEDPLTSLPNRALVMDRLQQAIEREHSTGQGYALLLVDVDRLQAINDTYGHATGDLVLRRVADTLCALVSPADTVGRYSGDRFAVLVEGVLDRAGIEAVAARVAGGLSLDLPLDEHNAFHVSACVGVAQGPASTAEALVSAGEAAMLRAKQLGRGRFCVLDDRVRDHIAVSRAMSAELAVSVAQQKLAVHYQPIVELDTGAIAGFEALVRWPHPRLGLMGPDAFLSLADALDLQVPIDEWVLMEACRAANGWSADVASDVSVAVNVAPAHLTAPGFTDNVRRALAVTGLDPGLLVLEVTENAVVADVDAAKAVLEELRRLGVSISIDDFGTGYSSMLQLRQLPFSRLKIDREFVRGLPLSEDDLAICASVISLASRLGVLSIAEGVETPEQAAILAAHGCQLGQGYLWSPAVDASTARSLLLDRPWGTPAVSRQSRRQAPPPLADPVVIARARKLHEEGASLHTIAAGLNRDGARTYTGRRWHPATVARLLFDF